MRRIVVSRTGSPEVLTVEDVPAPEPGPHQVVINVAAAGVNFIDTYHRSGVYPMDLPLTLGLEGAGTVVSVGSNVRGLAPGDAVAWADVQGSYAKRLVADANRVVRVPDGLDLVKAAALPLQAMTAHFLSHDSFAVGAGHTVFLTAAAGGVGQLLTQYAVQAGATVIGAVGSADKAEIARARGVHHVIRYDQTDNFSAQVRDLTDGRGVDVAYDGVGKTTFEQSLACVARRGSIILFGGAGGQVPPFDLQRFNQAGSVFFQRPKLFDYTADPEELAQRLGAVLADAAAGRISADVGATYALENAAQAHRDLESRATAGKLLLIP